MERVILHSDLNSFYASIEIQHNPALRGKPVAVCGSVEERHGIVLAANPLAKRFGVRTGDANWQAMQKCPRLVVVPPHMERYVRASKVARQIYAQYSDLVEPFGLDENWIDLTGVVGLPGDGQEVADRIRRQVLEELGVTVSVGVSFNKVFAKLGSDLRKPDATNVIPKQSFREVVWPLPVGELLNVGRATAPKLLRMGVETIGDLARKSDEILRRRLGVRGIELWRYANGLDDAPVMPTGYRPEVKSVGNSTTTPRDLLSEEDIRVTTILLAESVSERLRTQNLKCRTVQVSIRYSDGLFRFERQQPLPFPSCTARRIGDVATALILRHRKPGEPIRSLGVRGCNLVDDTVTQLSLIPEEVEEQRQEELETAVQDLRRRFGHFSVQRGIMVADRQLSDLDTRSAHSAQTVAFYKGERV